jgi:hypothetical protein
MAQIGRLVQVAGKARTLVTVLAVEVALFVIANATYGTAKSHGTMRSVSNVVWAVFLVGFFVMVLVALTALVQRLRRR